EFAYRGTHRNQPVTRPLVATAQLAATTNRRPWMDGCYDWHHLFWANSDWPGRARFHPRFADAWCHWQRHKFATRPVVSHRVSDHWRDARYYRGAIFSRLSSNAIGCTM